MADKGSFKCTVNDASQTIIVGQGPSATNDQTPETPGSTPKGGKK
jgi:hypothetical protein